MTLHSATRSAANFDVLGRADAPPASARDKRLQMAHQLQDTFTAVLAQFGREGFASAAGVAADPSSTPSSVQPVSPPGSETNKTASEGEAASGREAAGKDALAATAATEAEITADWNEWFNNFGMQAYGGAAGSRSSDKSFDPAALQRDYGQILLDAYRSGGYVSPVNYLRGLDKDQLSTIQTIHRLAQPIDVEQLQDEGAANLLIPPPAQVDFNRDGLTQVGIAQTIRFPDSTTPADVRDAWESATEGLSFSQKAMYELQMKLPTLTANLRINGSDVRSIQPGDPDWVNPMASPTYSFTHAVDQRLDYLDSFKNQIPPDQWSRDRDFWSKFRELLDT
jgi:hypothetical protein